ncbi:olfactory receptor 10G7-like [Gastrophryne carolinensis]
MEHMNYTTVTEFILIGLPHPDMMRIPLALVFLAVYICTLLGNIMLILAVQGDPQLHKPMYIFLLNLSVLDLWLSTVTLPKMLTNLLKNDKTISFRGCLTQLYFFHFFGSTECFLFTVMAYDRFLAICRPLHYPNIMTLKRCAQFSVGIWLTGSLHSMIHTTLTVRLPFCGPNKIDYFFCDIIPVLKLACADTTINRTVIMTNIGAVVLICFLVILVSYYHIVKNILKIRSSKGRRKTFSTCSSHMVSVIFYYAAPGIIYMSPLLAMDYLTEEAIAVFYTLATPLLNPIIYSLRNDEVKTALKKIKCKKPDK